MIPKFNKLAEEYNKMFRAHCRDVDEYSELRDKYHDLKKEFRESLDRAIRCDCERFGRTAAIGFLKAAMSMRTNAPIVRDFFNIARNDNKYQYPNSMLCSIFDKLYSKNVPPVNGLNDALHKWHYRDEIPEGRVWITVLEGAYLKGY